MKKRLTYREALEAVRATHSKSCIMAFECYQCPFFDKKKGCLSKDGIFVVEELKSRLVSEKLDII